MSARRTVERREGAEADHVVAVMAGVDPAEPRAHSRCLRCGERLVVELPVRVDVWLAASKAFLKSHRSCKVACEVAAGRVRT